MPRMDLHLSDEQTVALERELRTVVDNDRYQFSARIRTLREILEMIRPPAPRAPLPPPKVYAPPSVGARRRRR